MADEEKQQPTEQPKNTSSGSQLKAGLVVALVIVAVVAVVGFMNLDGLSVSSDVSEPPEDETPNVEPVIHGVTVDGERILPTSTYGVACDAEDEDGDALAYTWEATKGAITGEGPTVEWTAPDSEGLYRLTVTVVDPEGAAVEFSTSVSVKANIPPDISELTAAAQTIGPGATTHLSCSASDRDGDEITYSWTCTGGEVFGEGNQVIWLAPEIEEAYSVEVTVTDALGAEASRAIPINVTVGASPQLGRFTVKGINTDMVDFDDGVWDVFMGRSVRIKCNVTEGQEPFTYEWGVDNGTLEAEGDTAVWNAPEAKGPATVTVDVTDVDGDTTRGTVLLYVETCTCRF